MPPVWQQWRQLAPRTRALALAIPIVFAAVVLAVSLVLGVFVLVLLVGSALATVVYAKNRTDRHNAAVDRGEIRVADDPNFRPASVADLDATALARLDQLGIDRTRLGRVVRFDGGVLVKQRTRTELAAVLGDDGGAALFDPRAVTDLRAASEYRAGRGREVIEQA
jgi:hypothetical protein